MKLLNTLSGWATCHGSALTEWSHTHTQTRAWLRRRLMRWLPIKLACDADRTLDAGSGASTSGWSSRYCLQSRS
jgi:hypothetical protein